MKRAGKLLTVLTVAVLGAWGCAKGPANSGGQTERIHNLENKCAKLEEDYRGVASARDDARKKAANLEEENKRLQKQLDAQKAQLQKEQDAEKQVARERDDLRQQMESRTNERDVLQFRCDRLKKGLQNLLGQDEAYLASPPQAAPVLGNE
jgi:chromosome segregation ATPase